MKKKVKKMKKIVLLIIISLLLFFAKNCFAFENGDLQYWLISSMETKIQKSWKLKVFEELKFSKDGNGLYVQNSDIGLNYSGLAKWLDIGANYRLEFEKKNGKWYYENRPYFNVTFKGSLNNFKISNRSRLEYRDKEISKDGWRYRNKTTLKYPITIKNFTLSPYIADEVNADFIVCAINRNRLYVGFTFKGMDHLNLDFFYLWQTTASNNKWTTYNIVGTQIKLSF